MVYCPVDKIYVRSYECIDCDECDDLKKDSGYFKIVNGVETFVDGPKMRHIKSL